MSDRPALHCDRCGQERSMGHSICKGCELEEFQALLAAEQAYSLRLAKQAQALMKERAELRETVKRLNRRCQLAEAGAAEKAEQAGGSMGRMLANAEAGRLRHVVDELLELLEVTAQPRDASARPGDYDRWPTMTGRRCSVDLCMKCHTSGVVRSVRDRVEGRPGVLCEACEGFGKVLR